MKGQIFLLFFGIIFLLLVSGCTTQQNIDGLVKSLPEVEEFLNEHPNASVIVVLWPEDFVRKNIESIQSQCGQQFSIQDYYFAEIKEEDKRVKVWLEPNTNALVCLVKEGEEPPDQCNSVEDCDDGDDSTNDQCVGTPKKCVYELKTCSQRNGQICEINQICDSQFLTASDTIRCCPTECKAESQEDLCENVDCPINQKCVDGACVLLTCTEQSGTICSANQTCESEFVSASDTTRCCKTTCITEAADPCENVNCSSNQKCVDGDCVLKTCVELGGTICSSGDSCSLGFIQAQGTAYCCLGSCMAPDQCTSASQCGDDNYCTTDECSGSPKQCVYTPITACSSGDGCCPSGCTDSNDTDCALNPTVDFTLEGPVVIGTSSAIGEEDRPNCKSYTNEVYFTIKCEGSGSISNNPQLEVFYEDELVYDQEYVMIAFCENYEKRISIPLDRSLNGHNVTFKIDTQNAILETDETNNELIHYFDDPRTDLHPIEGSIEYNTTFRTILWDTLREPPLWECPSYVTEVFLDGVKIGEKSAGYNGLTDPPWGYDNYSLFNLDGPLEPGTHEVQVIVDVQNNVDETNELNNVITQTIEVT